MGRRGEDMKRRKGRINIITILFVSLFALSVLGCNAERTEEDVLKSVGYINFAEGTDSSRRIEEKDGLETLGTRLYEIEDLYWKYTARKADTGRTTGQTTEQKAVSVNKGLTPSGEDKVVGPFSTGLWNFEIFGYNPEGVLVYKGNADRVEIKQCEKSQYAMNPIPVQLRDGGVFGGILVFDKNNEGFYLTVPDRTVMWVKDAADAEESKLVVKITDKTQGKLIATSVTTLNADTSVVVPVGAEYEAGVKFTPGTTIKLADFTFETDSGVERNVFATGVHEFDIVAEYTDRYTKGNNTYTTDARYDEGFAPVGEIKSLLVEFVNGVELNVSGYIDDIKVNTGESEMVKFQNSVLKLVFSDTAREPVYYDTLGEAVSAWMDEYRFGRGENAWIVVCGEGLDDAGEVNTKLPGGSIGVKVPLRLNNKYISNLTLTGGSGSLEIRSDNDESVYRFDTASGTKITTISNRGNSYTITMDGGSLEIEDAKDHTVNISGKAEKITVREKLSTENIPQVRIGTRESSQIEELVIQCGYIELGNYVSIKKLVADDAILTKATKTDSGYTGGGVYLSGQENTVIENLYGDDSSVKYIRDGWIPVRSSSGSTADTSVDAPGKNYKALLCEFTLNGNGKKEAGGTETKILYGVEGMKLELISNPFSEMTDSTKPDYGKFMHWSSVAQPSSSTSGKRYSNRSVIVVGKEYIVENTEPPSVTQIDTLYALWALPIGGRVFYITNGADESSYHFYGAKDGEVNEIESWKNASDPIGRLQSAAYYSKADSVSTDNVYAAYTATDPTESVTAVDVSVYEKDTYTYFKDYGDGTLKFYEDEIGKGKVYTNSVSAEGAGANDLLSGVKVANANKVNGCNDWFMGTHAEYKELTDSGVFATGDFASRYGKITSLTEKDSTGIKVWEFTWVNRYNSDVGSDGWSLKEFGEDKPAWLVMLRSF